MGNVVVITGGSSGIGKSAAALFARNAYAVYELSRTGKNENGVTHITADITRPDELRAAFAEIFRQTRRLDVLVNNAGMGISGAIEFTDEVQARRIFDVNFFGTFLCCKEALPYLRQTPGARIINLSSVAAPLSIPFQAFYSATKAAVNALTLALANELRPFGIRVCAVMPGDTHTGFTAAREKSESGEALYGEAVRRAVSAMEKDELSGMSPDQVAGVLLRAARKKRPKVLYTVGSKYKFFVTIAKILPVNLCNRLVGKLYS
ncbi:MAG: SDR family NAD(P)-dependent oxidoreductase [Oscillospiraceae bacterium]|jgi:NAD(P)-dependent dehydrogenase (short-subunit alcohol dehydrogenase family)|nr:SDR family NAD(P)-dependent oxidoreductase [Oscillospiraceae bacterium]